MDRVISIIARVAVLLLAMQPVIASIHDRLIATVSPTEAYVGQPIQYQVDAYYQTVAPDYSRIEAPVIDPEQAQVIPQPVPVAPRLYDSGTQYYVYTRLKQQIIPLQPGLLSISPAVSYGDTTQLSNPIAVTIQPLPISPNPDVPACVGQFTIARDAIPDAISPDTPLQVRVAITPQQPVDQTPEAVQAAVRLDAIQVDSSTVFRHYLDRHTIQDGTHYLEYVFIANTAGRYTLPAIRLWTFDPIKKQYYWASTDPQTLVVVGDTGVDATDMPLLRSDPLLQAWTTWAGHPRDYTAMCSVQQALDRHPDRQYGVAWPPLALGSEWLIILGLISSSYAYRRRNLVLLLTLVYILAYGLCTYPVRVIAVEKTGLYTAVRQPSGITLHRDLPVYYLDKQGDWVHIQLGSGQHGWVPADTLAWPRPVF